MIKQRCGTRQKDREILAAFADAYPRHSAAAMKLMEAKHGYTLQLQEYKPGRTLSQNARYWAIVGAIAEYSGDSKEGVHNDILCEFHGSQWINDKFGQPKRVPLGRSKDQDRNHFSDLMLIAEKWAAEAGVPWQVTEQDI